MLLSQDSFQFNELPVELQEHIIQFTTNEDISKLMSVNKNISEYINSLAIKAAEKYSAKTPISNPFLQYLGFVEYMADCKRKNVQPEFNLEQFANLEHLHHPYNFYTYFVNDQRLRKLPNIIALHLASHNNCDSDLFNCFKELSDADKKFLENYEVNSSVTPINLLAGQYQLVKIVSDNKLSENEQLKKVEALVNKGVIFDCLALIIRYKINKEVKAFLESISKKNNKVAEKARTNEFTQEDFDKLGQEGEAQVNNSKLIQFLIYKNNIEFAKKLIEKGCNINCIDNTTSYIIFIEEIKNHTQYFNEFKKYNFNINIVDSEYESILFKLEDSKYLDFFIKNGLDIEIKNREHIRYC